MKRLNLGLTALALLSGSVFADTLNTGGSAQTFSAFAAGAAGTPYWNNPSAGTVNGSNQINVGNFLSDTGGFALNGNVTTGCPTCGPNYMAGGGKMATTGIAGNTNDATSALNFVRQAGALSITLLYAFSGGNANAEIGIYDQANPLTNHLILDQGGTSGNLNGQIGKVYTSGTQFSGATNLGTYNLANGSPYATWGIYLRTCEEGSTVSFAQCVTDHAVNTFYMGAASQLDSANGYQTFDPNHEHFALFQAGSNVNQFYAGIEDYAFNTAFQTANPTEGFGDYKDIILGINTSQSAVPEPATLSIMGLGLVGLGILGRRKLKK